MNTFMDLFIAGTMLVWATFQDMRDYTIPTLAVVWGVTAGLAVDIAFHGWHGAIGSGLGGLVGGALGYALVRVAKLGEGDAYLFFALGVIFGPLLILFIFGWSNLIVLGRILVPVLKKRKIHIAVAPYILAGTTLSLVIQATGTWN